MVAIVAILVVAGLAVAVWRLIATQYEERQGIQGGSRPERPRLSRPKRPPSVAPDDDPEFLAELARRTKRNEDNS